MRLANAADIPALMALEAAVSTAAHWTGEMYARIFDPEALRRLALVLEEDGKLMGFMVALCAGPEWELENLAVAEEVRRKGWGSRLLERLLAQAQASGAEGVFLEVRESNRAARGIYRRLGFLESGRKRAYYQDPVEDAIALCRYLQQGPGPVAEVVDSR